MIHAENAVITLHEWCEAIGPHYPRTAKFYRPASPLAKVNGTLNGVFASSLVSVDIQAHGKAIEPAATNSDIEAIGLSVKCTQGEAVIGGGSCRAIQHLDEGMGVRNGKIHRIRAVVGVE